MHMTHSHRPSRRVARGMTLVEVLVTLVLISVGLLGVAALQLTSLKGNQEAYVRSQASALAGFILDRMRANPQAFRTGAYTVAFNGTGTAGTTAGNDLAAWQAEINRLLPGGLTNAAGSIASVAGSPNIVTITIQWSERQDAATFRTAGTAEETLPTFQTRTEI
jgi:type IV pilus assembly protein PilV